MPYLETGSSREALPSSTSIMNAAAVTVFVIDWTMWRVSVFHSLRVRVRV